MVAAPLEAARSTPGIAAAANASETERQMRRVGVIADVHANLPALIAALSELERIGVDAIYAGGDLVGYGPHPVGVCQLLQSRSIASAAFVATGCAKNALDSANAALDLRQPTLRPTNESSQYRLAHPPAVAVNSDAFADRSWTIGAFARSNFPRRFTTVPADDTMSRKPS